MSRQRKKRDLDPATVAILSHWREAVPDDRLAHLVRDAARGLTRSLQFRLSEHGISFGHWVFLRILWERDGLTQRELSIQAGLMEPATHSAIQKMEKLGYIVRRHKPVNRKRLHIYLTRKGNALRKMLIPLAQDVNTAAVDGVTPKEIEITRRTLLAMIQNLADDEGHLIEDGLRITATRHQIAIRQVRAISLLILLPPCSRRASHANLFPLELPARRMQWRNAERDFLQCQLQHHRWQPVLPHPP